MKGDGIFALFGFPTPHEEDAVRAVQAALDVTRAVEELSARTESTVGAAVSVRVGVHRGLVFIDRETSEIYGLAANVTARLEALAAPGQVVISHEIRTIVDDRFDTESAGIHSVKGVAEPLPTFSVLGERPEPTRSGPQSGAPLVGRDDDRAVLRAAWRTACEGGTERAQSILIRGEPGIGKSRLAASIAHDVAADGAPVIELTGSSFHTDAGFHPVRRLLEQRGSISPDTPPAERLRRLRRELQDAGRDDETAGALIAPVLGLSADAGYEPVSAEGRKLNEEITNEIEHYLTAILGDGPALLLVEDLQWFDDSTIDLLRTLIDRPRGRLVVIITSRADVPLTTTTTVELRPLTAGDCARLVDALSDDTISPDVRRAAVERSDGIPLYVEELVRAGALPHDGLPGAVPDVLYEPLVARLFTTAHGVPVAAAAATIGRVVDRELLAGAVDISDVELDAELDALLEGHVLVRVDDRRFRFRHELLREVAYELLPESGLQRVHGRVADLLAAPSRDPDLVDWPVVAAHYARAGRHTEAADAYALAAERARARGAVTEARAQLGRAIDHIEQLPEGPTRMRQEVRLRLRRGFLAMTAETVGSVDAAADFARCLELAMTDAQGDEMFSTLISLWAYHLSRAELGRSTQVLDALRGALTGSRRSFRATNRAGYGMIRWFEGDFDGGREVLEEAVAMLAVDTAPEWDSVWFVPNDRITSMHVHLALARFMAGDTAGADTELVRCAERASGLAFPQGPWSSAYSRWLTSWVATERGDFASARAIADDVVESAGRHGFDGWTLIGLTQRAAVDTAESVRLAEPPDTVRAHAESLAGLVALWEMNELLVFLPFYVTTVAAALAAAGDTAGARLRYEQSLALAARTGMRFYDAETSRRLARLAGDDAAVVAALEDARALARRQGARPFELRIALDLHELGAVGSGDALATAVGGFAADADLADLVRARTLLNPAA